ncbi:MAG: ATP-binding protein [Verrucomicrobiota bacterium]
MTNTQSNEECPRVECQSLKARLEKAEAMLEAIQNGQVDAIVIASSGGPQLMTVKGMDNAYRTLVDTMNEGVLTTNSDDVILYGNRSMAVILKEPLERIVASKITDWIDPNELARFIELKTLAEKGLGQGKLTLKSAAGLIPTELSIRTSRINGSDVHFCIFADITELRLAEIARNAVEEQLRQSQKMEAMGTLAGGIAHDFNNIITSILGNAELARQDNLGFPQTLLSIEEIIKATQRARTLVQMILTFSHRQPTLRKRINLAPVLQETVRLLKFTLPSNVQVVAECDAVVPPVLADGIQIQQVLLNLANNAVAAINGKSGHITLRLDSILLDEATLKSMPSLTELCAKNPGYLLRLTISDDGSGMDAATQARLFEPFFTTKPMGSGSGLGLAVAHGIIHGHEGVITVESKLGKGSVFTIYLPAAEKLGTPADNEEEPESSHPPISARPIHLLYLDDDQALVLLVDRMLHRQGLRVSAYTRQKDALAAIRAAPADFDLVVTDYNMPGMSGLEVACAIHEIRADLPVALASGYIDEALQKNATEAGVVELIYKANAVEDFCGALQRLAQTEGKSCESIFKDNAPS